MKVLFLTLVEIETLQDRNIYTDLLREFVRHGHSVYVISPVEKRKQVNSYLITEENVVIIRQKIGNIQKTNKIEKGISTILLETLFKKAIKKNFSDVKFDLVLYSTPPITLVSAIEYVKRRDNSMTYLLLKDIFPQNAVDIGMMSKTGIKGFLYKHFRKKEKKLYSISDRIGCMSQANVDYVIKHNPEIDPSIVEVCPNSIEVIDKSVDDEIRLTIRNKYGIPADKKVFVYGGNLGKPQGIPFLIDCLKNCSDFDDVFFLIVGDGTEYYKIEEYIRNSKQKNIKLMKRLPKEDYDSMVGACDVGMIFLDHRFTIPNFPSRLLSYMQAKLPVFASTDPITDIGKVIVEGNFGWWCESNDINHFISVLNQILEEDMGKFRQAEFDYLKNNYNVGITYDVIVQHINKC